LTKLGQRFRVLVDGVGDDLHRVLSLEGCTAGEESVKRRPHGVDVGAHIQFIAAKLFRRRVRRCAHDGAGGRGIGVFLRQSGHREAEVTDLHRTVRANETVGGLDVAVQHPARKGGLQAGDDVEDCVDRLGHRERAAFLELVVQSAASGNLHCNHRDTFDLLGTVDVEAVRMVDARGEATFPEKALSHVRRIELLPEHLQGDAAPGGELLGFVDGAHAAAAEQSQEPVFAELTWALGGLVRGRGLALRQRDGVGVCRRKGARHEAGGAEPIRRARRDRGAAARAIRGTRVAHGSTSRVLSPFPERSSAFGYR